MSRTRHITVVGRGLMIGLRFSNAELAGQISSMCFENGVIVETCGPGGNTLKLLPSLTIPLEILQEGLEIIALCVAAVERQRRPQSSAA